MNKMKMNKYKYLKVCTFGGANTLYLRVNADNTADIAAADELIASFDSCTDSYAEYTLHRQAHRPGVAVDFCDRAYVGL